MTLSGIAYRLRPLAPRTAATGSLPLLPTPHGMAKEGQARRPGPTGNELGRALTLLPTPSAWLGRREVGATGDASRVTDPNRSTELSDQIAALPLLPTPRERDWKGSGFEDQLPNVVKLLPTPMATNDRKSTRAMTASENNGRRSGGGQSSPPGLEDTARALAGDYPEHFPPPENLPPKTVALLSSGANMSPPSDAGKPSTGLRLNPSFVEWMMGTPNCGECGLGWTDPDCPHSATAYTSTSAGSSASTSSASSESD
jgi:hypothetical protein